MQFLHLRLQELLAAKHLLVGGGPQDLALTAGTASDALADDPRFHGVRHILACLLMLDEPLPRELTREVLGGFLECAASEGSARAAQRLLQLQAQSSKRVEADLWVVLLQAVLYRPWVRFRAAGAIAQAATGKQMLEFTGFFLILTFPGLICCPIALSILGVCYHHWYQEDDGHIRGAYLAISSVAGFVFCLWAMLAVQLVFHFVRRSRSSTVFTLLPVVAPSAGGWQLRLVQMDPGQLSWNLLIWTSCWKLTIFWIFWVYWIVAGKRGCVVASLLGTMALTAVLTAFAPPGTAVWIAATLVLFLLNLNMNVATQARRQQGARAPLIAEEEASVELRDLAGGDAWTPEVLA